MVNLWQCYMIQRVLLWKGGVLEWPGKKQLRQACAGINFFLLNFFPTWSGFYGSILWILFLFFFFFFAADQYFA